ncbi:SpoIIE family protein phosphatase [Streptomyces sp. NPDC096132]|uniref:SpoIIE family protein phosphatase n=1 Tax=Streptomyces sp. NPDC096132 TaxID=3366075 RepID=UPI003828B87A
MPPPQSPCSTPSCSTSEGRSKFIHIPAGPPLGTGLGEYTTVTHPDVAGGTLIFYTDGLVERAARTSTPRSTVRPGSTSAHRTTWTRSSTRSSPNSPRTRRGRHRASGRPRPQGVSP